MTGFVIFLMVVAMFLTLGVVFAGVLSMARGGAFNQKWANKLMRARIVLQFVALCLFGLAIMLMKNGGA